MTTTVPVRRAPDGDAWTAVSVPPMISIARSAAPVSSLSVFCASSRPPTRTRPRQSSASTGSGARALATATSNASRRRGSWPASSARLATTSTPCEAEPCARVDEEGGLVLVGLDQGQLEVGPHDLEREAGEPSAGPDVHHLPGVAQVLEQDQAVLDQTGIRPGHQAGPLRDHSCELNQLRIVHEMPIYEYRCESCSGKFDVLTRFAERDEAQVCPSCESTKTRVLVSSFAFAGTGDSSSSLRGWGRRERRRLLRRRMRLLRLQPQLTK